MRAACSIWGFQQSLDLASSSRSIKLQMAWFRRYTECTPSWLNSVVCMCATTGVRRFCRRWLYTTGGPILNMQSSYNSTVAAGILTETEFICSFQSAYWNNHSGCAAFIHPTKSYPRFSACSNGLSRLIQHLFTRLCHLSLGRIVDESQETVTRHRR